MLTVTKAACERLMSKLAKKKAAKDQSMRFTCREGGWKLRLDRERKGDMAYAHEGRTVLVLDADVAQTMDELTLDARRADERVQLELRRSPRESD